MQEILNKTSQGESLTKKELKTLLKLLGLRQSGKKKLSILFNIVFLVFMYFTSLGFFFINLNLILFIATSLYLIVIIYLYLNYPYFKKVIHYFNAIDQFYDKKFKLHFGYETIKTINISSKDSYLKKDSVILLTNGYEMVIYDDLLSTTKYELFTYKTHNNFRGYLRVLDEDAKDRLPFVFRIQDIDTFKVYENSVFRDDLELYNYKNHYSDFIPLDYKSYVVIELKNLCVLKLGVNVLRFLRTYAPLKEIKES